MGNLIQMSDYQQPWRQVLVVEGPNATLYVYRNDSTGEVEILQMNNDNETVSTVMNAIDAARLCQAISPIK